jgi:hypothetical protein
LSCSVICADTMGLLSLGIMRRKASTSMSNGDSSLR